VNVIERRGTVNTWLTTPEAVEIGTTDDHHS
jgi:hypothetical protein